MCPHPRSASEGACCSAARRAGVACSAGSQVRTRGLSMRCGGRTPLGACRAPRACGVPCPRVGPPRPGAGRPRSPRRRLGAPVAGAQACPSRWGPVVTVLPAVPGPRQHGAPEAVAARTVHGGASGAGCRAAPSQRGPRARRWWPAPRPRRCPVRHRPAGVSHVRRGWGAHAARRWATWTASPPCVGGGAPSRPSHACVRASLACTGGSRRSATPPSVFLACAGGCVVPVRGGVGQAGAAWSQSGRGRPGDGGAAGPNKAVEPTAPMAVVWPAGVVQGAAAHRGRSASHLHSRSPLASMCQYGLRDRWGDHLHGNDGQRQRGARAGTSAPAVRARQVAQAQGSRARPSD